MIPKDHSNREEEKIVETDIKGNWDKSVETFE